MKTFKKEFKTIKEIEIIENETSKYKYKCACGHVIPIYPFEKRQSKVCRWCGRLVFSDKKEEFKHKLSKEMKKLQEGK